MKDERLQIIMDVQESISQDIQDSKVGEVFKVIIDREDEDYYVGRTQWDSPEVDPEVLIEKKLQMKVGEFYNVRITQALPFELMGEVEG